MANLGRSGVGLCASVFANINVIVYRNVLNYRYRYRLPGTGIYFICAYRTETFFYVPGTRYFFFISISNTLDYSLYGVPGIYFEVF